MLHISGSPFYRYIRATKTFLLVALVISGTAWVVLSQAATTNLSVTVSDPECRDTIDNDGDTLIDYPDDTDCDSELDNSEASIPECNDGIDNDSDGDIDLADDGCADSSDDDESDDPADSGSSSGATSGTSAPPAITTPTTVTLSGRAYPLSTVIILQDGQEVVSTIAGPDAHFSVSLTGISAGNYTFSVVTEDDEGLRSTLFTFPITTTESVITEIGGIFLSPTITTDKIQVRQGDPIIIFGQTIPDAEVTIEVNSEEEHFLFVDADSDGEYLAHFNSALLAQGEHTTHSRTQEGLEISSQSALVGFTVGTKNISRGSHVCSHIIGDLNCDNRVNLVDFSIAAFWYDRTISGDFWALEQEQLNGDGRIDLVDFSLLAFYWTG